MEFGFKPAAKQRRSYRGLRPGPLLGSVIPASDFGRPQGPDPKPYQRKQFDEPKKA